jgi:hypothetical protein
MCDQFRSHTSIEQDDSFLYGIKDRFAHSLSPFSLNYP